MVKKAATSKPPRLRTPRLSSWYQSLNGMSGPTLADPDVKTRVVAFKTELRKDPEKLREWYVKNGILTPGGRLTKRYGG